MFIKFSIHQIKLRNCVQGVEGGGGGDGLSRPLRTRCVHGGGGSTSGNILRTYFMDGPTDSAACTNERLIHN